MGKLTYLQIAGEGFYRKEDERGSKRGACCVNRVRDSEEQDVSVSQGRE